MESICKNVDLTEDLKVNEDIAKFLIYFREADGSESNDIRRRIENTCSAYARRRAALVERVRIAAIMKWCTNFSSRVEKLEEQVSPVYLYGKELELKIEKISNLTATINYKEVDSSTQDSLRRALLKNQLLLLESKIFYWRVISSSVDHFNTLTNVPPEMASLYNDFLINHKNLIEIATKLMCYYYTLHAGVKQNSDNEERPTETEHVPVKWGKYANDYVDPSSDYYILLHKLQLLADEAGASHGRYFDYEPLIDFAVSRNLLTSPVDEIYTNYTLYQMEQA